MPEPALLLMAPEGAMLRQGPRLAPCFQKLTMNENSG